LGMVHHYLYIRILSQVYPIWLKNIRRKQWKFYTFFSGNRFINIRFIIWNCLLQEGVRIIPLISSKQLTQSSLQDSVTSNNYIPHALIKLGLCQSFWPLQF
jgi:hypothetical protein